MRDGVKLAANVYRPAGEGPWPVLLLRQPYGRETASTVVYAPPEWFALRGYLVVVQDVRGRGGSEGTFDPLRHEAADGYDSVMWAAGLPGSNGRVGMYGFSYQGATQLRAALARPPPLQAIAPHMTAFDFHSGWFYRAGMLQVPTVLRWANQLQREDVRRTGPAALAARLERSWQNPAALGLQHPLAGADPITDPQAPAYVRDWLEHDESDAYWRGLNGAADIAELDVPVFHLAGWYDYLLRGTMADYRAIRRANRAAQFLVCGPWEHFPWGRKLAGSDHGPEARPDIDAMLVAWFDHWLKDRPRDPLLQGVRYFMLGENRWHSAPVWPPPETRIQTWFLQSGGRANSAFGDGRLDAAGASGPPDRFTYDPETPVLAPGGQMNGTQEWGPSDLAPAQQANNLLVYTPPPFEQPWRMAGTPRCRLFVHSTAPDTAFVARLSRVARSGSPAAFLTLGAARLRDGQPGPGGTTLLDIPLDDTTCGFAPGESLRLDIASSAFPLLARHPNTSTPPNRVASPAEFRRAVQTVYHDRVRPSALELPVLP